MSVIIPSDESLLDGGAFISPSGKIYRVKNDHEAFCEEFLSNLNELISPKRIPCIEALILSYLPKNLTYFSFSVKIKPIDGYLTFCSLKHSSKSLYFS